MGATSSAPKMTRPAGVAGSYTAMLDSSKEFMISQTTKGCFQELLGCEANSQFKFLIMQDSGQPNHVGMIEEESNFCIRLCCKGSRPWETFMVEGQMDDISQVPAILKFVRPFRCALGNCKCCCFQEVETYDGAGGSLGGIREKMWFCIPTFQVYKPDNSGEYDIHMPTCCGGMCVNLCAQGCCNCRIPFYIYPAGSQEETPLKSTGSKPVPGMEKEQPTPDAQICKVWSSLGVDLFTDADQFEFKAPDNATADSKARLIASTLMINQIFFEQQAGDE